MQNIIKGNVFASTSDNASIRKFIIKTNDGTKVINGTRLLNCSQFFDAVDGQKREFFQKVKAKVEKICKLCNSWEHNSNECTAKLTCKRCNFTHVHGACALQSLVNCAATSKHVSKLCVQDISIVTGSRHRKGNSIAA